MRAQGEIFWRTFIDRTSEEDHRLEDLTANLRRESDLRYRLEAELADLASRGEVPASAEDPARPVPNRLAFITASVGSRVFYFGVFLALFCPTAIFCAARVLKSGAEPHGVPASLGVAGMFEAAAQLPQDHHLGFVERSVEPVLKARAIAVLATAQFGVGLASNHLDLANRLEFLGACEALQSEVSGSGLAPAAKDHLSAWISKELLTRSV